MKASALVPVSKPSVNESKFSLAEASCLFSQQNDWQAPEHEHRDAQLAIPFVARGVNAKWHDGSGRSRSQPVQRSACCIIPSGQPHRLNWAGRGEIINVYLQPSYLERLAEELTTTWKAELLSHYDCQDLLLLEVGSFLREGYLRSGRIDPRDFASVIDLVTLRLIRNYSSACPKSDTKPVLPPQRLKPAIQMLRELPQDAVRLSTLAQECRTSLYHFARSFKANTGLSPLAYQRRIRLEQAKGLLASTLLPIQEIAIRVGYNNPSHFARLFRRWTGLTPSAYRDRSNSLQ